LRPWADALLAGALLVLAQWQVWGAWHDGGVGVPSYGDRLARAALAVVMTAPLALRRRYPLPVAAAVCAGIVGQLVAVTAWVPFLTGLLPMAIANYTAAAYARRWRWAALVFVLATEAVVFARIPEERASGEVLFALFVALGTWTAGDVVRARSHRAQQALGDAQVLLAQSEAMTAAALADERRRIARELHDVIAHSVSVMGVQAGAARLLVAADPEAARAALLEVEGTARSSVEELARLLAVLRDDDHASGDLAPQPGLAQLEALVAQVRTAGVDVSLRTEGDLSGLPPGVDLAAFRVAQEALTNVLKHSGAPTRVRVERRDGHLGVEVTNDRSADGDRLRGRSTGGARHGLIGMRERVQLYGGTLQAGPCPAGGFTVRAVLPVGETQSSERVQ
jgi:signal transduction histidine kinase